MSSIMISLHVSSLPQSRLGNRKHRKSQIVVPVWYNGVPRVMGRSYMTCRKGRDLKVGSTAHGNGACCFF